MNDRDLEKLYDFIREVVRDTVTSNSILNSPQKPPKVIGAEVISASGNDITLTLAGSLENMTITNCSGQTLSPGDLVEVMIKNGNYSNAFVLCKRP